MSPNGSEQALSLAWALENTTEFSYEDALRATCEIFGIERSKWKDWVTDGSWFVGDPRLHNHNQIESKWNREYSTLTNVWLDEDVWHLPLWKLWLLDSRMVFAANLLYLIKIGGRGTVSGLARYVKRARTTVSKWGRWKEKGRGVRIPPKTLLPKILEYFELKPSCDLYTEPLFLGRSEIRDALLRIQGKHYLDCLSGKHLIQSVDRLRDEFSSEMSKKNLQ